MTIDNQVEITENWHCMKRKWKPSMSCSEPPVGVLPSRSLNTCVSPLLPHPAAICLTFSPRNADLDGWNKCSCRSNVGIYHLITHSLQRFWQEEAGRLGGTFIEMGEVPVSAWLVRFSSTAFIWQSINQLMAQHSVEWRLLQYFLVGSKLFTSLGTSSHKLMVCNTETS